MKRCIGDKRLNPVWSAAIALGGWWLLTKVYSPLVVPTIGSVVAALGEIAVGAELRQALWLTTVRLLAGLAAGVAVGTAIGAVLGFSARLHDIFRPLIGLMQSIPPVSWLVLALIWFGFSGSASIFIVAAGAVPIMVTNIVEGMRNIDQGLLEMARVYRFSRQRRLFHVVLPSIRPYFRAGLQVAIGIGSKTVVMGEVLTSSSGIGGEITNARLNIEPEGVFAWTIVIVLLYFLFSKITALLLRGRIDGNGDAGHS